MTIDQAIEEEFSEPESPASVEEAISRFDVHAARYVVIIPTSVKQKPPMIGSLPLYLLQAVDFEGSRIVWHGPTARAALLAAIEWEKKGYFPVIPYCCGHQFNMALESMEPPNMSEEEFAAELAAVRHGILGKGSGA